MLRPYRTTFANRLWEIVNLRHYHRFVQALSSPQEAQWRLLAANLRANAGSEWGRRFGFGEIRSVEEFRRRVPLSSYDDYAEAVARLRQGERRVLTAEPVRRLQPTSGSSSGAKWIPCTRGLQGEISRAVGAWVVDLFRRHPRLRRGRAYWSISPAMAPPAESSAVPLGFADDSEYLGGLAGWLARQTLAVPPEVARLSEIDAFRRTTLEHLCGAPDLALVSVWHPSFFTLLLDALEPCEWRTMWPHLTVVSCWADAQAAGPAAALKARLPGVVVEPKGLMATEGVVSIPFRGQRPAAVTSHFLEFLEESGLARGVHELEAEAEYEVVLTTRGGLYRYRLGDRVRVTGFLDRTPCLEFVGRGDLVSDLAGEKLAEAFVGRVLAAVLAPLSDVAFAMLAPELAEPPRYVLLLELAQEPPVDLGEKLDAALLANPHYAHCRRLGQLGPVELCRVGPGAHASYLERRRQQGQRLGDIKPTALVREMGWRLWLGGLSPTPETPPTRSW